MRRFAKPMSEVIPTMGSNPILSAINMKDFFISTVGCQMNVSDSERLSSGLKSLGLEKSEDENSDLVVINTCVVRQAAEDTTTGFLGKLKKIKDTFKFVNVSTDEVFGSLGKRGIFSESSPYQPNSPYSASKAGADHLVRAYYHTYAFPGIITNCSNNFGPYQFPEKLIPQTIYRATSGQPILVYGDGTNVRDWLYVRDHVEALWLGLTSGESGESYNIGADNEWANLNLIKKICDMVDRKLNREVGTAREHVTFVTDRQGHDFRYAIDASKIRQDLGWKPAHDFEPAMEKTVNWYLCNQDWLKTVMS